MISHFSIALYHFFLTLSLYQLCTSLYQFVPLCTSFSSLRTVTYRYGLTLIRLDPPSDSPISASVLDFLSPRCRAVGSGSDSMRYLGTPLGWLWDAQWDGQNRQCFPALGRRYALFTPHARENNFGPSPWRELTRAPKN